MVDMGTNRRYITYKSDSSTGPAVILAGVSSLVQNASSERKRLGAMTPTAAS